MNNKSRFVIQMTLAATILLTLAVTASSTAQALPGAETMNGLSTIFLPLVSKNYSRPTGTSFELIEQALRAGEIDQETALVYKVFATFLDPRLPGQYQGEASLARDTLIMGEVAATWSSLSPATQALLAPFILPPAAPGSWLELQQGQTAIALAPEPVEWVTLTRPGGGVKVWYQTRYPGDDARAAQILADMEDIVWPALTDLMGRGPKGDDGLPNNGGDGLFDIYLVRLSNHGEVHSYPPKCENRPSYMLINGASTELRPTIVHEFMHALIDGYTFFKGCEFPEYRWLNEATATWAEDFISPKYDTGNSEHMYASAFLTYPELSLESREDQHEYGAYLLPFYLARSFQPELIRTIWDATASKDSLAAIDGAIHGGFLEQWPEFVKLNLNREPMEQYQHWDNLPMRALVAYDDAVLSGAEEVEIPLEANLSHLAALYYEFTFSDPEVNKVRFVNGDRFFSGAEPRAKVQALIKIEGQGWTYEDWTDLPERKFCRTKPEERLEELIIIFSNSEWQDRLDVLDPGSPGPSLVYNDQPCSCEEFASVQNWTGQVEYSFTTWASEGAKTISYNHRATVNLQMGLAYQDSYFFQWTDVSLGGTGEVNDRYDVLPDYTETLVGSGALTPDGPMQDDPSASLSLFTSTCTFKFHLQTKIPAVHTIRDRFDERTYSFSGGVGFMDINDIPASQLTGSRVVPAVYRPYDEPSWYAPGSVLDSDLASMVGNNLGEATISWSFVPAD
jgi:hypothetical protein